MDLLTELRNLTLEAQKNNKVIKEIRLGGKTYSDFNNTINDIDSTNVMNNGGWRCSSIYSIPIKLDFTLRENIFKIIYIDMTTKTYEIYEIKKVREVEK
jgi:hypothetical protein